MARVFIGIGSNEGDRLANVSRAIQRLATIPGVAVTQIASMYDTEPVGLPAPRTGQVGGPPQPNFLNTVVEVHTALAPRELLKQVKMVEQQLGRMPSEARWGPRVIDLDLLLYDEQVVREPDLTIPHERMHARRFVLEPLAQLAPELVHPVLGQTIAALLDQLGDQPGQASCPCD